MHLCEICGAEIPQEEVKEENTYFCSGSCADAYVAS